LHHDVLPFFFWRLILAFESRTARDALSGTFPATAGTLIFAQSPHPRNRQFGWACFSEPYYLKQADSEFPQVQTI
jgi:hypothetical protein